MTLNGKEYEDIPSDPPKRIYGVYEEGKRTKVKFVWLDRYIQEPSGGWGYASEMLTLSNYGSVTLDGKPLRNENDIKLVKEIFVKLGGIIMT